MGYDEITLELIKTVPYRASFLNKRYLALEGFEGILKPNNEVVLFSDQDIEKYARFNSVRIYHASQETLSSLRKRGLVLSYTSSNSIITKLDAEYFLVSGKKNKEKRNILNRYYKNIPLTIKENPNSLRDVIQLIDKWKKMKSGKYRPQSICIGYDKNFISTFLYQFEDKLVKKFLYQDNVLIGFTIVERIFDNVYNLLIRKSDPDFSQLDYFIDFTTFREIFENDKCEIIVNLGIDSGKDGIYQYKKDKFSSFKEIKTFNIKINMPMLNK